MANNSGVASTATERDMVVVDEQAGREIALYSLLYEHKLLTDHFEVTPAGQATLTRYGAGADEYLADLRAVFPRAVVEDAYERYNAAVVQATLVVTSFGAGSL